MKEEKKEFTKVESKEVHKEVKEVHKPTEKASISVYVVDLQGFNKGQVSHVTVKDETSKAAFETYKKIRDLEKEK